MLVFIIMLLVILYLVFLVVAEWEKKLIGVIFVVAKAVPAVALLVFVALVDSTPTEPEQVEEQYREIVSLKDGTRKESYGFLTVYSSLERDVYSYYYMTENGGYKRETIGNHNVTIFEEDSCTPRVTTVTTYTTKREVLGIKWDDRKVIKVEYNIYVPKGSIVREFKLDAE